MIGFRFVQDNQADLPVKRMCALVEVAPFVVLFVGDPEAIDPRTR